MIVYCLHVKIKFVEDVDFYYFIIFISLLYYFILFGVMLHIFHERKRRRWLIYKWTSPCMCFNILFYSNTLTKKMKISCVIVQFKSWNLDPRVAELIAPTYFNTFRNNTSFHCNNGFSMLQSKNVIMGNLILMEFCIWVWKNVQHRWSFSGLGSIVCRDFKSRQLLMDILRDDRRTHSMLRRVGWAQGLRK